jgi:perosamine synthetase
MALIPVTRPWMGCAEEEAAARTIRSGWVMAGPRVAEFESKFADATLAPYACAVHSCTAGLRLALRGLGVGPGDVVVTVSHSFIATANAVRLVGAEPVFIDIDPTTLNMDPIQLAQCLDTCFEVRGGDLLFTDMDRISVGESPLASFSKPRGRLAAILVVHQVGLPADMRSIMEIALRHDVPVLEDAACAIGSKLSLDGGATWQPVGKPVGNAVCFSFHPRKVITTGEGGIVTTADARLDGNMRVWRQHGMDRSPADRESGAPSDTETYLYTAGNERMTDIQAAIGIEQLGRLSGIVEKRRKIAAFYKERLSARDDLSTPVEPDYARTNFQSFVITLTDPDQTTKVMNALRDKGVDSRPGIMCAHLEPPYQAAWPEGSLPHSEEARRAGIILPLFPNMDADMPNRVMDALEAALRA